MKTNGSLKFLNFLLFILTILIFVGFISILEIYIYKNSSEKFNSKNLYNELQLALKNKNISFQFNNNSEIKIFFSNNLEEIVKIIETLANKYKCELKILNLDKNNGNFQLEINHKGNKIVAVEINKIIQKNYEKSNFRKIAIIIDDAGYNSPLLEKFLNIPGKITISVLPCLPNSSAVAKKIYDSGKEVMIHLPMEPEKNEKANGISCEILTSMNEYEISEIIEKSIKNVPFAVGVNNHQGSKATTDAKTMKFVLKKLKEKNLFFVDSLTSNKSVAGNIAKFLNVQYLERDVFLDNKDEYDYIKTQFDKLIKIALKKNKAIGIGHINSYNTAKVIYDSLDKLKSNEIKLVFVSELIDNFNYKEVN